jgi:hypothetical protein
MHVRVDRFDGGGPESIVLRRLLLAVLFCLSVWTLADRTSVDPAAQAGRTDSAATLAADATTATTTTTVTTANIAARVATPPIDTHPPEARWEVLLPQSIGSSSSRSQQPQAQAADLPGVSSRVPWPAVQRANASRHAARFRQTHLLHTPLLI